jgi:hypothetical protein
MANKRIVRREILDHITRPLLARVLAPYAELFAARGVLLEELAATDQNDRRLVGRVDDVVHEDVAATPAALRSHLAALDALANGPGQAALFELCPALVALRPGPEDTAAMALLDHPEAFARVKRLGEGGAGLQFTDFDAVSDRAPDLRPAAIAAFKGGMLAWLVPHGRTELCNVNVCERAEEVYAEIEHGRPPVTDDIVSEALELKQRTDVRAERAIAIVDRATCRLSVHAGHAAIKELLRRLVGLYLFGNAGHFHRGGVYSLAPLAKDLDAALSVEGVPGLKGVTLLAITVLTGDERVTREAVKVKDLRESRRARELFEMLSDDGAVEWVKLRLAIEGRGRPLLLELSSSRKKVPRMSAEVERTVDEWLLARGFIVLASHRRVIEAEAGAASMMANTTTRKTTTEATTDGAEIG